MYSPKNKLHQAAIVILSEIFLGRSSSIWDRVLEIEPMPRSASKSACSPNWAHGSWDVQLELNGERPTLPPLLTLWGCNQRLLLLQVCIKKWRNEKEELRTECSLGGKKNIKFRNYDTIISLYKRPLISYKWGNWGLGRLKIQHQLASEWFG